MTVRFNGEEKVYGEFLTNLAVAWFSVGVISPFFAKTKSIGEIVLFTIYGILGALVSLRFAVLVTKGGKR